MRYFPALALLLCAFRSQAQEPNFATLIPDLMTRANIPGLFHRAHRRRKNRVGWIFWSQEHQDRRRS
jgi:hypothetical protein